MAPPWVSRRAACWAQSTYPMRLTSTTSRRSSTRRSVNGPIGLVTPALLTRPVSGPSWSAASKMRRTWSGSVVSAATVTARRPAARTSAATDSAAVWSAR